MANTFQLVPESEEPSANISFGASVPNWQTTPGESDGTFLADLDPNSVVITPWTDVYYDVYDFRWSAFPENYRIDGIKFFLDAQLINISDASNTDHSIAIQGALNGDGTDYDFGTKVYQYYPINTGASNPGLSGYFGSDSSLWGLDFPGNYNFHKFRVRIGDPMIAPEEGVMIHALSGCSLQIYYSEVEPNRLTVKSGKATINSGTIKIV
jgi:hypothetical protein